MKYILPMIITFLLGAVVPIVAQNALDFDGTNDYIQTNITSLTGTANRTVEAWIKTTGTVSSQQVLVGMGTMPLGTRFTLNVLNSKLRIEIGGGGLNSVTNIDDGAWHHVAVTYNSTASNNFILYIDGVADATGNISGASVNTAAGTGIAIGRRNDAVNNFNGQIDEVRIWNTTRSPAQIQANYNTELCVTSSLVAYYKLNQGTANGSNASIATATDATGNGNTGTLNNFTLSGANSNWTTGATLGTGGGNTTSSFSVNACSSYTSPSGVAYTSSQTVTDVISNTVGCDSIMTIDISINNSSSTINANACVSYTSPSGVVYTSSQTITETIQNAAGCDSVMTINITIGNTSSTASVVTCESYTSPSGTVYTSSQTVLDTIPNAAGCDSTITINLTVETTVDVSVTDGGGSVFMANAQNATFEWIYCDSTSTGITTATINVLTTPHVAYAVVVTTPGGCVDTSTCYVYTPVSTDKLVLNEQVTHYPNPTTGAVFMDLGDFYTTVKANVYSMDGRVVETLNFSNTSTLNLYLEQPKGMYFIELRTGEHRGIFKVTLL